MILQEKNNIFQVQPLVKGLSAAARCLARILITDAGSRYVVSGWLLTDTLILMPEYAVKDKGEFLVYLSGEQPMPAQMVFAGDSSKQDRSRPALLQLSKPMPGRTPELNFDTPVAEDTICILQHPEGKPEQHVSIGKLVEFDDEWVHYTADTLGGSSGGPVFNFKTWTVTAMHVKGSTEKNVNTGLRISAIIDILRETSFWPGITKQHQIADTSNLAITLETEELYAEESAPAAADDTVYMRAALSWNFDRSKLSDEDKQKLESLVVEPNAEQWALSTSERQRILGSNGFDNIKLAEKLDAATLHPGQEVIDRITQGPPFDLQKINEQQLPYWLQAVRWFSDVVPGLPTPAEVNRVLERKRMRSRLRVVSGGDFRGRSDEIKKLNAWYKDASKGPMLITGLGGMGKSALIAHFAEGLSQDTLLFWLDFDRPDLAPDDAVSVLVILAEQCSIQLDDFPKITIDEKNWEQSAKELGAAIAKNIKDTSPPLMILDGFEVAQQVKGYQEIWELLKKIMQEVPVLKVIVSGRAAVKSLQLQDKAAELLPLKGMAPKDAEGWLREHGVNDKTILERVLAMTAGIPLALRLAVFFIEKGGDVKKLPEELPKELIDGLLYRRILDRVIDPVLSDIAKDVLILRKLVPETLSDMLADRIPAGLTPAAVYEKLSRDLSLVGGEGELQQSLVSVGGKAGLLQLRPEVRSATLKLLELDDAKQVKLIDRKAADWYARQDITNPDNAAELVYHLLRLKELNEAKKFWRTEFVPLLKDSVNDLPESAKAERKWLEEQVGNQPGDKEGDLRSWENETVAQLKSRMQRGIIRDISPILAAKKERSDDSELVLYDAWERCQAGSPESALDILKNAKPVEGPVQRDRNILHAYISMFLGEESSKIDNLLAYADDRLAWIDRLNEMEPIAVRAARIRLMVNIGNELSILQESRQFSVLPSFLKRIFSSSDIILPSLNELIDEKREVETYGSPLMVPLNEADLSYFLERLNEERAFSLDLKTDNFNKELAELISYVNSDKTIPGKLKTLVTNTAIQSWSRWKLVTQDLWLADVCRMATERSHLSDPLRQAIINTLPAFRGQPMGVMIGSRYFNTLDEVVVEGLKNSKTVVVTEENSDLLQELMKEEKAQGFLTKYKAESDTLDFLLSKGNKKNSLISYYLPPDLKDFPELASVVALLSEPDPLEILCKRILGLPDDLKLIP